MDRLWHLLWAVECDYWADVDLNRGLSAAGFYTDDAVFDLGISGARFVGRAAIAAFYERRRAQGVRTSAHIVTNFSLLEHDGHSALTRCYLVLHAGAGERPLPTGSPGSITVAHNRYRLVGDRWSITERVCQALFASDGPSAFAATPDTTP